MQHVMLNIEIRPLVGLSKTEYFNRTKELKQVFEKTKMAILKTKDF